MKRHFLIVQRPSSSVGGYRLAGSNNSKPRFAVVNEGESLAFDEEAEDVYPRMPYDLIEPVNSSTSTSGSDNSEWVFNLIGATTSLNGTGITVAVLDTGIDASHSAFSNVNTVLSDFTNDPRGVLGSADDAHGHGTHCAGTLLGRDVNGIRIGVARGVNRLLVGKVLQGGEYSGTTEAIYSAMQWAIQEGADIISMSLAINYPRMVERLKQVEKLPEAAAVSEALEGYRLNLRLFDSLAQQLEALDARGRGVVVVAAAGNHSRRQDPVPYTVVAAPPANADGFISVAALERDGTEQMSLAVPWFSNGRARLAAPGVGIWSAERGSPYGLKSMNGTSMATPIVAGVAALWGQTLLNRNRTKPRNWARSVISRLTANAKAISVVSREDVGDGLVQSPVAFS